MVNWNNPKKVKEHYKENKEEFREYVLERNKKRIRKNKERIRKKNREYQKRKRKIDLDFRIKGYLRIRLWETLNKYTKTRKIMSSKKYGIDYKAIIEHLKPFPKDLSNYQIHHIKPLFTFNFVNPDGSTNLNEVKEAFSPQNHKWLTIEEHRNKKLNKRLLMGFI